jgi:hypothetical protein
MAAVKATFAEAADAQRPAQCGVFLPSTVASCGGSNQLQPENSAPMDKNDRSDQVGGGSSRLDPRPENRIVAYFESASKQSQLGESPGCRLDSARETVGPEVLVA